MLRNMSRDSERGGEGVEAHPRPAMLRLSIRTNLIRQKIGEHFGGSLAKLADNLGRNRSTVWRWLSDDDGIQFPKDPGTFLSLGAALDVDPMLLLEWHPESFPWLCERISRTVRRGDWNDFLPSLAFLDEFLWPTDPWPPNGIATHYARHWWVTNVEHDPTTRGNYYG